MSLEDRLLAHRLLPLPAASADERGNRRRDVRADPDPAVAHAQDERGVQRVARLREGVGSGEHHAGDAEDERGGGGRPDDEASQELLSLDESGAAHRDLAIRRLDRRDLRDARGFHLHRPRVPSRTRFDLTEALEQLVDVAIDVVPARGRVRKRRGQRVRPRVVGRASLQLALEVSNLPSERAADAHGEPAEPDEEDRGDEHVRRVDPSRDVRRKPGRRRRLGIRERPSEVRDDGEEAAEDDRQRPRSHQVRHPSPSILFRNRIYFIPSFSFLISARRPSKGISRPESCEVTRRAGFPWESAQREGSVDTVQDPGETIGGAGTRDREPRGHRVVLVHQSRDPLSERTVRPVKGADRVVLSRDDRDLPLPADADHRRGDAADPSGIPSLPGMRSAPRRPDGRGTRSPPPDRADAEAVGKRSRFRGGPPQGRRRGALLGPRVEDGVSRGYHDLGAGPGERFESRPHRRDRRPGPPRAAPARPEPAAGSAPQALSPTKTRSSSRIRYVTPQISRPSYVKHGTFNSPRIVETVALPWFANKSGSGTQNTEAISGPGVASIGAVASAT